MDGSQQPQKLFSILRGDTMVDELSKEERVKLRAIIEDSCSFLPTSQLPKDNRYPLAAVLGVALRGSQRLLDELLVVDIYAHKISTRKTTKTVKRQKTPSNNGADNDSSSDGDDSGRDPFLW